MTAVHAAAVYADRLSRVRRRMVEEGVDTLLLSVGRDLPWLTGYDAMPLERLTMLVLPADGDATMVVPRLEAPRVVDQPGVFELHAWDETTDPLDVVAALAKGATLAIGDQTWARFVVDLLRRLPGATWRRATDVIGPLRVRKDAAEVESLARAGAAADRVASQLHAGDIPLAGRTEAQVSTDISDRLVAAGHQSVNFAIVAAGENAASPHHHAGPRVIRPGDIVLCDFGGTLDGYCSDITRCVHLGPPPPDVAEAYAVLLDAQQSAVAAAVVGTPCEAVDAVARDRIAGAGYGDLFVHRTGHGIGMDAHEDPYLVSGNGTPLQAGHAFSIEPGIYATERGWGMRLEDIVVATDAGPRPLNNVDHNLVVIDS